MALASLSTIQTRLQNGANGQPGMSAAEAGRKLAEAVIHRDKYDGANVANNIGTNLTLSDHTQLVALAKYLGVFQSGD